MSSDSNNPPPIHRIIYRDVLIEVFLEQRGGTCCGLDHQPDELLCINCGNPLEPREVHTIAINETPINGFEIENEAEAIDLATKWVDHLLEFTDDANYNPDKDFDAGDSDGENLIDEDPNDDDKDDEPTIDLANPPPNQPDTPLADGWGDTDLINVVRQMNKMGWFDKAVTIAKGRKNKPPKKS